MKQRIVLKKEPRLDVRHKALVYQVEAFRAVRDLEYAAVFHEQGLGKTKIAIDVALYWLHEKMVDTVLFVVKKAILANWRREFAKHTFITPKLLSQDRRANFFVFNSPARIIVTHYEVLRSERERFLLFLRTRHVAAILDESTKIKNPDSSLTKCLFELSPLFARRVIMTGTPVANRPYDIWAQVWFLDHGASLGRDFGAFRRTYDLSNRLGEDAAGQLAFEGELATLFGKIRAFSVRENKNSEFISLPQKVFHPITVEWEPYQLDLYRQIRDNLRAAVVREGLLAEENAEELLKRLLRLLQVASNPRLVDHSYSAEPGKLLPLRDLIESILQDEEKCIVWTAFTANVDWLTKEFRPFGARKVHGKLGMEQRDRAINTFLCSDDCRVLVATPGAAREGLTLTVANHAVFYDRNFSLDDYLQAQDRIHRISQDKTCHVHNLIMTDSIDEWVDVLLHSKQTAARLAQGDVSRDEYRREMSYEFGSALRHVLNIAEHDGGGRDGDD